MRSFLTRLAVALAATSSLVACGSDDGNGTSTTTTPTSTTQAPATSTTVAGLEQPAIWPDAAAYFATPEAAAKDFVEEALKVPAVLGAFRQGDNRSGEIQVFSQAEGSTTRAARGLLLLRQLGPRSGWFVTAAVNDNATISAPDSGSSVTAGRLTVSGKARGFEANVVVRAMIAGRAEPVLDTAITQGGAYETPEPYTVTLNLSGADSGDTVMLLVRGGTGLETDPGDFGAIAVVVR